MPQSKPINLSRPIGQRNVQAYTCCAIKVHTLIGTTSKKNSIAPPNI